MNSYISIDLETTGFSPDTCDILEIGAWKVKDGVVVENFCSLVKPIMYIPRTIQQLTGITMEDVENCETIETVLVEFHNFCEDLPFLGHNLRFDYDFLCYKGKALGLDFTSNNRRSGLDTLKLCKDNLKLSSYKLEDIANYFDIKVDSSNSSFHRAGYDSYITKLIYDRLLYFYSGISGVKTPVLLSDKEKKYGRAVNNGTLSFE